jgi:hypothetical protein
MSSIYFFATREDWLPVIRAVEAGEALKYVSTETSPAPHFKTYSSAADIPTLGRATSESGVTSDSYLVMLASLEPQSRQAGHPGREVWYLMDQLINPDTLTFIPAGVWNGDVLLSGSLDTAWDTDISKALMKRFQKEIRRRFKKIKSDWVGPEAERWLDAGKRLTGAQQQPREYDLQRS